MKKLRLPLFLFSLLVTTTLSATITWTNNGFGSNWSNPQNWDSGTIPTSNDIVIIPINKGASVCDIPNLNVRAINIGNNSNVTVGPNSHINVLTTLSNSIPGISIDGNGTLTNQGTIQLRLSNYAGVEIYGTLNNEGLMHFDQLPMDGIKNFGFLLNFPTGILEFDEIGGFGILAPTGIVNRGSIRFLDGGTGFGLNCRSIINESNGNISFEGNNPGKIEIESSLSSMRNEGTINFSDGNTADYCISFPIGGILTNTSTGNILINGGRLAAIKLNSTTFVNEGRCLIRNNLSNNFTGILCSGTGHIQNRTGGNIELDSVTMSINLSQATTSMTNAGSIIISSGRTGINVIGQMTNEQSGEIVFDAYATGLEVSLSGHVNNEGTLSFQNIMSKDIKSAGNFENQLCGTINGDNKIEYIGGSFINSGWLIYDIPGNNHSRIGVGIVNEGIIVDPYRRFENAFENQKIRIVPIINPLPNVPHKNALDIVDGSNLTISGMTTLPGGNVSVGRLNLANNVFFPNRNILTAGREIYANIGFISMKCLKNISIKIERTSNSQGQGGSEASMDLEPRNKKNALAESIQLYPNPTNGMVNLQFPFEVSGEIKICLIDALGRVVYQRERNAASFITLDFSHEYSNGVYALQIMKNGQLLSQNRLILQQ